MYIYRYISTLTLAIAYRHILNIVQTQRILVNSKATRSSMKVLRGWNQHFLLNGAAPCPLFRYALLPY